MTQFTRQQLEAAVAEAVASANATNDAAILEAVSAEQQRCRAIVSSPLFAGREAAAQRMIEKGMSAEDALDLLASTPAHVAAPADHAPANPTASAALAMFAEEPAPEQRASDPVLAARQFNAARKGAHAHG